MLDKHIFVFVLFTAVSIFLYSNQLQGKEENPTPIFCVGGGYLDAGSRHSGGVVQIEYKWAKYFWHILRPQITLIAPELRSVFLGLGIGWECNLTERITLIPSFSPGFYYKGNGRNLGFPIEFHSSVELSFRLNNKNWVGIQIYHISNAHLSRKNPGLNAVTLSFAFAID